MVRRSLTASLPSPANGADATTHRTDVRNFRCAVDRTIPKQVPEWAPAGGEHMPRRLGSLRLPNRPQRWSSNALLPALRRDNPHPRMCRCGPAEVSVELTSAAGAGLPTFLVVRTAEGMRVWIQDLRHPAEPSPHTCLTPEMDCRNHPCLQGSCIRLSLHSW